MTMDDVIVDRNYIELYQRKLERPPEISVTQWFEFWNGIASSREIEDVLTSVEDIKAEEYDRGFNDGQYAASHSDGHGDDGTGGEHDEEARPPA